MRRYNIISFVSLCCFLLLFNFISTVTTLGAYDKLVLSAIFLFPLIGLGTAFKGEGWSKWILVTLNGVVLAIVIYALVVSFSIGKSLSFG